MNFISQHSIEQLDSLNVAYPSSFKQQAQVDNNPSPPIFVASTDESLANILAIGRISALGPPTEPDTPLIEIHKVSQQVDESTRKVLLQSILNHAKQRSINRLLITNDPMDAAGIATLTALDFTPAGRGPYHILSSATVEYVTGYSDATGSNLDFVWTAE